MISLSPNRLSQYKNDRLIMVIESLLGKDTSYVRTIIWGLSYNPSSVIDLVKPLKSFTRKELLIARNEIRANYEKESKFPIFGFFENPGALDFCRKDPIARDMVCMKINTFFEHASKEQSDRIVILFASPKIQFSYGGIRALGFTKEEADYLINILDIINLSKYIEKIIKEKASSDKKDSKQAEEKVKEEVKENLNSDASSGISNVSSNSSFSKEEFAKNVLANLDDIEIFFNILDKLEKSGISLSNLLEKRPTIQKLLELKGKK